MRERAQSTNKSTTEVPHQAKWVDLRESRACENGVTYAFTDGSSLGGFGAVLVRGGVASEHTGWKKPDKSRNVGAELDGMLLALEHAKQGESLLIVSDYLGVAAWMTKNWAIKKEEVRWRVAKARELVEEKALTLTFCHHGGHQSDDSDFTRYNCAADGLAGEGNEQNPRLHKG